MQAETLASIDEKIGAPIKEPAVEKESVPSALSSAYRVRCFCFRRGFVTPSQAVNSSPDSMDAHQRLVQVLTDELARAKGELERLQAPPKRARTEEPDRQPYSAPHPELKDPAYLNKVTQELIAALMYINRK